MHGTHDPCVEVTCGGERLTSNIYPQLSPCFEYGYLVVCQGTCLTM